MSASDVRPHLSEDYCMYRGRRLWGAYFCSSLSVFVGGLVILLICKVGSRALRGLRVLPKQNRIHPQQPNISQQTYKQLTSPVEYCMQDYTALFMVDVVFNLFYAVNFGLRFVAAQNELRAWVELKSLIDIFTIIPSFIGLFTKRAWLGLKFLRALHLLELPSVLQLNIPHSNTSLKLTQLITVLVGSLLTAAGALHLVENSGDPWSSPPNIYIQTYFESVYCLVATMSTVGYGDVVARTVTGKFFIIIFIVIGLGLFASYIPEVFAIIRNRKRFKGSYTNTSRETHVVVCGHITLANASAFMQEFLHKDRGDVHVKVLFLGNFHPNQELVAFFSLHFLQASFYEGSVLKRRDQERVMMNKASACLILCDRFTDDQNNEDVANLMRVISIKRYCPDTRVIVQMFKHSSKAYLQNVPNWDWSRGDAVICLAELKLGFMAQSCQVPGLSTLLANLFTMQSKVENEGDSWQNLYREGSFNKMYTEYLSSSFNSLSFTEASKLCFLKLKLLLIGIEYQSGDDDLSQSDQQCDLLTENQLRRNRGRIEKEEVKLDSTGLFHWCTPVPLQDITLTRQAARSLALRDHVLVGVFGDEQSSLLGLSDFMMPLRASSLTSLELKTVVFLADPLYFSREWPSIQYFPNVFFLPVSITACGVRYVRADLFSEPN
ncbi:calcium-activated potassium channel subunit alpha-1-like [Pygocentrus nattereri]|uniref:calcium-activated potassium channel subunit alpha-1-like n=1 Tax=Pygocentrus nattereri TaxID=42514 RepID=UPI001891D9B9|nr:calcium-activated potassium channel subunit alpha-1-like [Pygocentrus nattereri]